MSMDIFNRPPSISEDTLHYFIYPAPDSSDRAALAALATNLQNFVDSSLVDFLWHRDSFELKVAANEVGHENFLLEGTMRVGDCVDDEWCIVWLLREMSSRWDVAISLYDSDGDFLLIEAAKVLPSWVSPANSENRVWIYQSGLHLIPLTHISPPSRKRSRRNLPRARREDDDDDYDFTASLAQGETTDYLAVEDALKVLRDTSIETSAPSAVTEVVWERISGYPGALRHHVHLTNAHLPEDIARALTVNPSLVQKAVEAFYTRDAIQLRAAQRMSRFPPHTSVLTTVKLTRPAYAQLSGQKFFPPKIFGVWKEQTGSKEWRWKDIGMKISAGFEMVYQESKNKAESMNPTAAGVEATTSARKDSLSRSPEYRKYTETLRSTGYFGDEIEGSQRWQELESKAINVFVESQASESATRPSFAAEVLLALSQAKNVSIPLTEEDSDSWLDVDAESFEHLLEKNSARPKQKSADIDGMDVDAPESDQTEASKQAERLKDLTDKIQNFVEGEGDLEGARFEDEQSSDEEFSDENFSDDSDEDMDEPETPEAMAERQAALDKLVPAIDPAEYGKMPTSYSNSQKVAPTTIATDTIGEETPGITADSIKEGVRPKERSIRRPILPRDDFDGVDSDDETDEEEEEEDEDEEDRPQIVGDVEIDMGEEEAEFLEFSRKALGISDEQWRDIVKDRKERGAFVPSDPFEGISNKPKPKQDATEDQPAVNLDNEPMSGSTTESKDNTLDSFEAVMKAMDAEMGRLKKTSKVHLGSDVKGKGKAEPPAEEEDEDIEMAMEAELKAALEGADEEDFEEAGLDYNLIKNFLESFKSQAGLAGPVGNLAGMLQPDWKLPRDNS